MDEVLHRTPPRGRSIKKAGYQGSRAMISISTRASRGSRATSTVDRAGLWPAKRGPRHRAGRGGALTLVRAGEVFQALDKPVTFANRRQRPAGGVQDRFDVVEGLLGL